MTPELQACIDHAKTQMMKAIDHLENEMAKIRAGRANPSMLDNVDVDYYGNSTPLSQVANIGAPDPRTLTVQPWEKSMIEPIEKAIRESNLGFNPQNDGTLIRINIPPLTEERRLELVKKTKGEAEHGKVSLRNIRREANEKIKGLVKNGLSEDLAKDAESSIQQVTDQFSGKIDAHLQSKEKEIMTV
ncbi:MAG: ribosome recycling factor [Flavobacteriales bacterium]|nr:ribosome recycling factor [Flavobacteriales bacterium]